MSSKRLRVVIIDPEDREQAERLTKALVEGLYAAGFHALATNGIHPDNVQAALRSLITPPKLDEPQGLGAVVKDAEGRLWIRAFGDVGYHVWHSERIDTAPQQWHSVAAVKILSDGVRP